MTIDRAPEPEAEPGPAAGPDPDRSPSRLVARRRAELLDHTRAGDLAHAVDLAFEHLAEHGPDPALLGELCSAARRTSLDPVTRTRLHELIRRLHPELASAADPCAGLTAASDGAAAAG